MTSVNRIADDTGNTVGWAVLNETKTAVIATFLKEQDIDLSNLFANVPSMNEFQGVAA